jgi:hypothetical protein
MPTRANRPKRIYEIGSFNPSKEDGIMPSIKSQAMRLALYLSSVQQLPSVWGESYREYVDDLTRQFQQLQAEQREEAKRLGRMRIRECGDLEAAVGHLVPVPAKVARMERAFQRRREKARQWPPEAPACPECKVRGYDIPKRSWPSQEMAEVILLSLRDPQMVTYRCPVQPGFWHLGHTKARNNST